MTKTTALTILQDEYHNADEGEEGMRPVYAIAIKALKESKLPAQLYSTFDDEGTEMYSFSESVIKDYGTKVTEHDAAEFFHSEAELRALGDIDHSKIGARQLAELFCELYKV